MLNEISVYQRIFLHAIHVRVIVPWSVQAFCRISKILAVHRQMMSWEFFSYNFIVDNFNVVLIYPLRNIVFRS